MSITVDQWAEFAITMAATNSKKQKMEIVKKFTHLRDLWYYLLSPDENTHMTVTSIMKMLSSEDRPSKKHKGQDEQVIDTNDVLGLMRKLCKQELRGHSALRAVVTFLNANPRFHKELVGLFGKKANLGLDIKSFNKALEEHGQAPLVDIFKVALANEFSTKTFKFPEHDYYISRKLDGMRAVVIVTPQGIDVMSRNGHRVDSVFEAFKKIWETQLYPHKASWPHPAFVLDGELCWMKEDGVTEDFSAAVSIFRKKDHTSVFKYHMFDLIPLNDFKNHSGPEKFSTRFQNLKNLMLHVQEPRLHVIQIELYSEEAHARWLNISDKNKWEGLMVRKDAPYTADRSNDLLKLKKFCRNEFKVTNITTGTKHMLNSDGVMEERKIMSAAIIVYNGVEVGVGSGFSDQQRLDFIKHPESIIGKTIEVQYFEETSKTKDGKVVHSLRFPTFKCLWGDVRDV